MKKSSGSSSEIISALRTSWKQPFDSQSWFLFGVVFLVLGTFSNFITSTNEVLYVKISLAESRFLVWGAAVFYVVTALTWSSLGSNRNIFRTVAIWLPIVLALYGINFGLEGWTWAMEEVNQASAQVKVLPLESIQFMYAEDTAVRELAEGRQVSVYPGRGAFYYFAGLASLLVSSVRYLMVNDSEEKECASRI